MGIAQEMAATTTRAAMSGFGFSLGRDVYKGTKRNFSNLIMILAVLSVTALSILGVFVSGLWFFRNYRNNQTAVFTRIKAILILLLSLTAGAFPLIVISFLISFSSGFEGVLPRDAVPPNWLLVLETWTMRPEQILYGYIVDQHWMAADMSIYVDSARELVIKWLLITTMFMAGAATGLAQRRDRKRFWDIEKHNRIFIEDLGMIEVSDGFFEDLAGNRYRLETFTKNRIELFVLGRRNKRAYFYLSDDGRIKGWSDIVDLGSNAKGNA